MTGQSTQALPWGPEVDPPAAASEVGALARFDNCRSGLVGLFVRCLLEAEMAKRRDAGDHERVRLVLDGYRDGAVLVDLEGRETPARVLRRRCVVRRTARLGRVLRHEIRVRPRLRRGGGG